MKISSLLQSLTLVSAIIGFVEGEKTNAFFPRKSKNVKYPKKQEVAALSVRGGAGNGIVEPATATNVFGSLVLAQGVYQTLAASKCAEAYGCDPQDFTILTNALSRRAGVALTSMGLYIFALHMQNYSVYTAMALGSSVWIAEWLYAFLNESEIGMVETNLFGFVLSCASTYGCLKDADWATNALKIETVFALLGGLSCSILSFEQTSAIWNLDSQGIPKSSPWDLPYMRGQGYNLLGIAIMGYTLIFEEKDILLATGRMATAGVLFWLKAVLMNEMPDEAKKTPGPYIWMALNAIVAYTLLVGDSSSVSPGE